MKFSALMTVYSMEKPTSLDLAIRSLLWQTVKPSQIVIVKDGILTKELDDVIEYYDRANNGLFTIVQLNENKGIGTAAKIGLEYCKYDIVARLDSDDISLPSRFEKQLEFLKKHHDISVVGTWSGEFEKHYTNIVSIRKPPENMKEIIVKSKRISPLTNTSTIFRKEHVIASGGYLNTNFGEDYYLWARMLTNGYKLSNIPEVLVLVDVTNKYKKRGGIKLSQKNIKLQNEFLRMGFIGFFDYIFNIISRIFISLIPNNVRRFIYRNILRKLDKDDLAKIDFSIFNTIKKGETI